MSNCTDVDREYLKNYIKNTGIYKLPNNNLKYLLYNSNELDEQDYSYKKIIKNRYKFK